MTTWKLESASPTMSTSPRNGIPPPHAHCNGLRPRQRGARGVGHCQWVCLDQKFQISPLCLVCSSLVQCCRTGVSLYVATTALRTTAHSTRQENCALRTRKMPSSARQEALGHELSVACKQGHLDRVQRLLAAGAAKEIPTPVMGMMMTPLNAAAYTNNVRPKPSLSCGRRWRAYWL